MCVCVGYHRKGYNKQEPKNCLDLVNIEAKRQPRGLGRFSDSPEAHAARPRSRHQLSVSPEAPLPETSDEVPILRFDRGPTRKASDEVPILRFARGPAPRGLGQTLSYRLARGRLDIDPITAAWTNFPDRMYHPTTPTMSAAHRRSTAEWLMG